MTISLVMIEEVFSECSAATATGLAVMVYAQCSGGNRFDPDDVLILSYLPCFGTIVHLGGNNLIRSGTAHEI